MSDSESKSKIERADEALARYYKQHNVQYFDNDGAGKFQSWADDNGFDTDGIEEEFDVDDANESTLVDVDDNFPGDLEAEQIIAILGKCWNDKNAYTNEVAPLQVTAQHWKIEEHEKKDIIKIYETQCKTIFDSGMKADASIIKLLCVGHKLNEPYLQFLADMYSRDRLNSDCALQPADWALKNKHCIELKSMKTEKGKPFTETVSAVGSFFHRIVPKLMLNTQTQIIDSIASTAKYICGCVDFVSTLAKQPQLSCPFQIDFMIAYNEAKDCSKMALQGILNESDDDESDDESDDEKNNIDTAAQFFDCFGNIKNRLSKEGLLYAASAIMDEEKNNSDGSVRTARMFMAPFNKFKNQQIASKYTDKNEFAQYPRKHRFCSLIDRRKASNEKGTSAHDEILFFEPPNNCNSMPSDSQFGHVALWYFDSTRTCIIPNIGYEHGKYLNDIDAKSKTINDAKKKALNEPITSQTPCKGAILVLSFHVESDNEIRAYLYLNGQVSRFLPQDIINILPRFFDKNFENNKEFPKSKLAKDLVDHMKPKLKDIKFDAFYSEYKNK